MYRLSSCPEVSVEELPPPFRANAGGFSEQDCFAKGLMVTSVLSGGSEVTEAEQGSLSQAQAARCMRVYPSETMEGFFVCRLRKN